MKIKMESLEKEPVDIAEGVYWVGYSDENRGLHCNPYLIIEGDEAALIDGGNRDDFSTVMLKILRTGIEPSQITRLIYQHYDPDLCGSLPQLEAIINNDALRIISHSENNVFIHYYSAKTEKLDFRELGNHYEFSTGRRLEFYATPYCHHPGSFVTYEFDEYIYENILNKNNDNILKFNEIGNSAKLAVPTPDHFYPLLYVLGASNEDDKISVYNKSCELGSLTMTSYLWE